MYYDDRITIATPEGVDVELSLAGVASRFTAAIVDVMIQFAILLALTFLALGVGAFSGGLGNGPAIAVFSLGVFFILFGYDVGFEVLAAGRTPGKRAVGLRVVMDNGSPITFWPSCVRNLLRLADFYLLSPLVGMIAIVLSERNKRLGDMAAGTIVSRDRRDRAPVGYALPRASTFQNLPAWDVSAVTFEEIGAMRSFLARRAGLELRARREIARSFAATLRARVPGVDPGMPDEYVIELVTLIKSSRG